MSNLKTKCGLFAICSNKNGKGAIESVKNGLIKLQHRGQEGAGICYPNNNNIKLIKGEGLVEDAISSVPFGNSLAMGHVRYSTSKSNKESINEVQPYIGNSNKGVFGVCHNGNIPIQYRQKSLKGENDTMFIVRFISDNLNNNNSMIQTLENLINEVKSAYCLIVMFNNKLYLVRDKFGVRPLIIGIGKLNNVHSIWISSESCAFPDNINIIRDVDPGEIISLENGLWKSFKVCNLNTSVCTFEYVYFLKESSIVNNVLVKNAREKMGTYLSEQDIRNNTLPPLDSIVVGAPNSGITAGIAYSKSSNLNYSQIIIRKVKKRTFIENNQKKRINAVNRKFSIEGDIKNKSIVFVDDSLVRGNTVKGIINMLKDYGAKEIHIRIASPPIKYACYFGIDIPDKNDLIATKKTIHQIKEEIGADSLQYLDVDNTIKSIKNSSFKYTGLCTGCFNNKYNGLLDW